jgi:hypothetical protein
MKHFILSSLVIAFSASMAQAEIPKSYTKDEVLKHVSSWSKEAKDAAAFMINKYGVPSGVTPAMVVWNDVKPFKRSVLYKEAVVHKFPMEHKDVLEHFIDYKITDAKKVMEIWNFDGSVILERTKGEMSARCDREEANVLALNLADQIATGKTSVESARMEYGRQIMALKDGSPKELTQKLVFTPASSAAGDADMPIMDQLKKSDSKKQAQEDKAIEENQD